MFGLLVVGCAFLGLWHFDVGSKLQEKRTDGVFPVRDRVRSYLQALGAVGAMDMSVRAPTGY